MAITLHGVVTLSTVDANRVPITVDADGALTHGLRITGRTSGFATLASAKEAARLIRELAWYGRHAGGLYVNSSEMDIDDGLYRLDDVEVAHAPGTGAHRLFDVSLTLTRLGGAGAGGNVRRLLFAGASLQTNSWSITSTPWYATPIGAAMLINADNKYLSNADGASQPLRSVATYEEYVLNAADYNRGECKVWDTGGSGTRANWTRVFSPDHAFASPDYCAIDNGLVTYVPIAARPGQHDVQVWDSSAWRTITGTTGDGVLWASALPNGWTHCRIDELTPWRVVVSYYCGNSTAPYVRTKRMTIWRGRHLALYELTGDSAARIDAGIAGNSTYTQLAVNRDTTNNLQDARDHLVDAAAAAYLDASDNWLACTSPSATAMGVIATRLTTNIEFNKSSSGGIFVYNSSATTLACYLGGLAYNAGSLLVEAEAGTLTGTAIVGTVAGASGGASNNVVSLPALNDRVESANMTPPAMGGTSNTVRAYARLSYSGTSASDSVQLQIWNQTAGAQLTGASTTKTFSAINALVGATDVFIWISTEGTGWNGTDNLRIRVTRSAAGGGGNVRADEYFLLTIVGGGLDGAKTIANAALTEMTVLPAVARAVR